MRILGIHAKAFVEYALMHGIRSKELLTVLKRPSFDLENPKTKIDENDFYALIHLIASQLDDPLLGLRVGQQLNLNTMGAIYRISLKTTSMLEALHYCQSYLIKTFPSIRIATSTISGKVIITPSMNCTDEGVKRIILEAVLSVMEREVSLISGINTKIVLCSPYRNNKYPAAWKKSNQYSITFQQKKADVPVHSLSKWGLDVLIPEYLALIISMESKMTLHHSVKIAALRMARPKLPDIEMLAVNFNLNARTLQRRLKLEGSSFRHINEELKQEISELLIRHNRFSVGDIAAILGYSESASFIHSFRKWYGKTPLQLREEIAG